MPKYFNTDFCLKKFRSLLIWFFNTEHATETVSGNGGAFSPTALELKLPLEEASFIQNEQRSVSDYPN